MREYELDRLDRIRLRHGVEIGQILAPRAQLLDNLMLHDAVPHHDRLLGVLRQIDLEQLPGNLHLLLVDHPGHAVVQQLHMFILRVNIFAHRQIGIDLHTDPARILPVHAVIQLRQHLLQLRMGLHDMVALHEGFHRDLPVRGQSGGIPPFGALLVHAARFQIVQNRPDAFAQRRSVVVKIDEGAADGGFNTARHKVDLGLRQLLLAEKMPAIDEGVLSFDVPAPSMEWADEARRLAIALPARLGDWHTAMAAGIVERLHPVFRLHDDDGTIEIGIFNPVADILDEFQTTGHLPNMRPQTLVFRREKSFVIIALGRNALRIVDGKWNVERRARIGLGHGRKILFSFVGRQS